MAALRISPFGRLLATYTLDEAADWLLGIALAVLVYDRTDSALAVAAVLLASRFGPSLVIAPLAGRLGSRRLGAALGGLYGAAAVFAALVAAGTALPVPVLLLLTFAATTCAATGRVLTRTAAMNLLDGRGLMREGAAALNVSYGAVNVLGPAAAGAATVLVGSRLSVVAAAALFAGLALATWSLGGCAAGDEDDEQAPATLRETLAVLRSSPAAAAVLLAAGALLVIFGMDEPLLLPYMRQSLGGGAAEFATFLTVWGVGILLGGATFTLVRRWSMTGTFVLAGTLLAGTYLVLGVAHDVTVAYAVAVLGGAGNGMFWGALNVVTIEAVPPAMRARTSGVVVSLALATPGLGYVLGGALSELLTPAQVSLLAGGLGGLVVLAPGVAAGRPALAPPAVHTVPSTPHGG